MTVVFGYESNSSNSHHDDSASGGVAFPSDIDLPPVPPDLAEDPAGFGAAPAFPPPPEGMIYDVPHKPRPCLTEKQLQYDGIYDHPRILKRNRPFCKVSGEFVTWSVFRDFPSPEILLRTFPPRVLTRFRFRIFEKWVESRHLTSLLESSFGATSDPVTS